MKQRMGMTMKCLIKLLCVGSLMIVTANSNATPSINYLNYICAHMNFTGLPVGWTEANTFKTSEKIDGQKKGISGLLNQSIIVKAYDVNKLADDCRKWTQDGKVLAIPMRRLLAKKSEETVSVQSKFLSVMKQSDENARASALPVKIVLGTITTAWVIYKFYTKKSKQEKHHHSN